MDTSNFKDILTQMQQTLECSICLELLSNPVSTRCDHQFCSFCIIKFLQSKRSVPCPLCKRPVTKRGIQERSELSQVINKVKQLIAAYEADTRGKFTPSKTCKEILPEAHTRKTNRKQVSDRQMKSTTKSTDCQNNEICYGNSEGSSVPVCESTILYPPQTDDSEGNLVPAGEHKILHPLGTDLAPRTRSRSRGQVVCSDADTVVSVPSEESTKLINSDLPSINGHRRPGRKRRLSFLSETSDTGDVNLVEQKEILNDNLVQKDEHKTTQDYRSSEHHISNADILCYLEEGSCGAVTNVTPSNGNKISKHVISTSDWEVNSNQEPADSNKKCDSQENIPQAGHRRKLCTIMNSNSRRSNSTSSNKSVRRSSKAKLPASVIDSSNAMSGVATLSADTSPGIVMEKTCPHVESQGNKALEHCSEMDPLPLPSNNEAAENVSEAVSPSSDVSSVSSTQQLLKPKPVTARTYSRDMRKFFHDGFVKNWADTLPEKSVDRNNSLSQLKGLTTKEKIYTKKQKGYQPSRLPEETSSEHNILSNAEFIESNNDSLKNPAKLDQPLAHVPNRKSIFKSRSQNGGNKNCLLDNTLPNETKNQQNPFEFTVGHTPVKPKRKIGTQGNAQKADKTKEVSGCKVHKKNSEINVRKCEVAVVQSVPPKHVALSKQESAHEGAKLGSSSTEVVDIMKTASVSAVVSKTLEEPQTFSCVQTKNLLNSATKKNKTVHFDLDLVDIDKDVQLTQENVYLPEVNIIAEVNATVTLDSKAPRRCEQNKVVKPNEVQNGQTTAAVVPVSHSISTARVIQELQLAGDSLNLCKNVAMNDNGDSRANESTGPGDVSVDVTLKAAQHTSIKEQKSKTKQSPDGDASCFLPDPSKVCAPVQKRKFARRGRKLTCPDTETFSQKAGKELTKLIHKINDAEDYELMFNTQDVYQKLQEDLQKEQTLEEAFGFATQDSDHCRFNKSKDETESKMANTTTETGDAHMVAEEMVDQFNHITTTNTQAHGINPKGNTINVLDKTDILEKRTDLEGSSTQNKSLLTYEDIDNTDVVSGIDTSIDGSNDYRGDYHGESRINSMQLGKSVESDCRHISQVLQVKTPTSLQTKEHVDPRRARIFPRPNFSEMVQVSPCAKGALAPTNTTLISSGATELHTSHMDTVSGKLNTAISVCKQSQMKQEGSYCGLNAISNVQSSNITDSNQMKGQDSPGFEAMCMQSHILISSGETPEYNPKDSSTYTNKVLGKFSVQVNTADIKTRNRTTVNTAQLSLKSKNTSEAAFAPPDKDSEKVANNVQGCDIILAPDTCIYSSGCRTTSEDSKHAAEDDVILETLDFDTNLQHTNDVHTDHIVLSPLSPVKSHGFDQKSTFTPTYTTNRSEEAIAESLISTTSSTQDPVILPQGSLPQLRNDEFSSNHWLASKKTKVADLNAAPLTKLSSEKTNVEQTTAIVIASQGTSSGGSAFSQSILHPTGATFKQGAHKKDQSHSDNCSRFQKHSLDKNRSACGNLSKSLCLTVPKTPNSRASLKNQISSAPCRITFSESEDDDHVLIVRRKKRKCFSLDGSPLKPVVFGNNQKVLEVNLAPGTKNYDCEVDLIGETEAMKAIDTWTERDVEENDDCYISESQEAMDLAELRAPEEDRSSTMPAINKMSAELLELPTGRLRSDISSEKLALDWDDSKDFAAFPKRKSQKRLFSPSKARLTRRETNRQLENNSTELGSDMTVIKLCDNVNEDNKPNKLSEDVDISVPETNIMSQGDDDDNSHKSGHNDTENVLIDTRLDISLLENTADSRSVSDELEKGKQTKRGLAKKGHLNLDTIVKHPRGVLSPASKAVVNSGIKKPTKQKTVTESGTEVIHVDIDEEEGAVDVLGHNRTLSDALPSGSPKRNSDLEIVDSGSATRRQQRVDNDNLPVKTRGKKSQVKSVETEYHDAKKQLEQELFGLDSEKVSSRKEKDTNQEIPAGHTKSALGKAEKTAHTYVGSVADKDDDDELFFDLGDSSNDDDDEDGRVKMNAGSDENKSQKSEVVDQLDDSVSMPGSLPVTSSPLDAGNSLEHGQVDQSVITAVDETDFDDEDSVYTRPKSRVKRFQISSDSEDYNQEALPVRSSVNCTSSSALSSQSEILNTEQQEALEEDVAKLHQQIAEFEAKLAQEGEDLRLTPAVQEERTAADAACVGETPSEDEDSDDLFVSPLSPSPPARQSSIKPVPKRPAHSKPNRQTDQFIKQFQSPGGTVRTKKSLEFTLSTAPSHSQANNSSLVSRKSNCILENKPLGLNQECVLKKQSSDKGLQDVTDLNIVCADANNDEVMDINDPSEDKLMHSPVILSQKSRLGRSQSEKRDINSSVDSRVLLTSTLNKDVCLVASALGREEHLLVVKLAEKYGLKFTSQFSREVTHVVMKPATGYDRVCDRTMKFFQGVAYKCWVVAFPWVLDSLQTGALLPEGNYEIIGDTSGGENTFGAKHSRISREHLFTDFCLACVGDSREMPKESLHELLTVCGATVVDDPIGLLSKVAKFKIIVRCSDSNIAPTSAELDMFNGLYKHMGLLTVMREWVLDSLGSYRLQPLIEYVLNTGVTNVPF